VAQAINILEDVRLPLALHAVEGIRYKGDDLRRLMWKFSVFKSSKATYEGVKELLDEYVDQFGEYDSFISELDDARLGVKNVVWAPELGKSKGKLSTIEREVSEHSCLELIPESFWPLVLPSWVTGWKDSEKKRINSINNVIGWGLLARMYQEIVMPRIFRKKAARWLLVVAHRTLTLTGKEPWWTDRFSLEDPPELPLQVPEIISLVSKTKVRQAIKSEEAKTLAEAAAAKEKAAKEAKQAEQKAKNKRKKAPPKPKVVGGAKKVPLKSASQRTDAAPKPTTGKPPPKSKEMLSDTDDDRNDAQPTEPEDEWEDMESEGEGGGKHATPPRLSPGPPVKTLNDQGEDEEEDNEVEVEVGHAQFEETQDEGGAPSRRTATPAAVVPRDKSKPAPEEAAALKKPPPKPPLILTKLPFKGTHLPLLKRKHVGRDTVIPSVPEDVALAHDLHVEFAPDHIFAAPIGNTKLVHHAWRQLAATTEIGDADAGITREHQGALKRALDVTPEVHERIMKDLGRQRQELRESLVGMAEWITKSPMGSDIAQTMMSDTVSSLKVGVTRVWRG
jgi:hypothetical protein